ncbi:MAG: hypothetical protein GPJ54_00410 [Candidatus Heimdallarchaeota archaeon]|nr:hypothetical protein [Candidatus Heimdallarchaeota archaeon]
MSNSRVIVLFSFLLIILINPSNNFIVENSTTSDPRSSDYSKKGMGRDSTQSQIRLNAQPWNKISVVEEGKYEESIDGLDAVYDGSNYHVIFSIENTPGNVYYTNYSGSLWSNPIIIFDGINIGIAKYNYSEVDSIALEYESSTSTFYLAINAYNLNLGHDKVLYIESKSKLSNITSIDFDGWILGNAFHRPEKIRLTQYGDTVILGYQRFISVVGSRPYAMRKNTTSNPNWDSAKLITNENTNSGNHYFEDIAYSPSNSKFLVFLINSSSPQYEKGKIFESSDGLSWIENTSFGNLPSNPEGFSSVSLEEYNNELYATYSINQDRISNKQFRDLVITTTEGGQFLPYLDYIEARGAVFPPSSNDKSKTMFVNGNLVVIALVRTDFVSTCNCEPNIVKMYIGTGVDIPAPALPTLTSPPDQTILNNQTVDLSWTVNSGEFGYYEIFRDEVKIQLNPYNSQVNWGTWTNNKIINYTDFTRLPEGTYNFTINMYDTEGNFYTDTVWITSTTAPFAISTIYADNGTMFIGEITTDAKPNSFWYIYGGLSGSYDIYRNDTIVQQGTFTYDQIKYNYWVELNDGPIFSPGIYNYTIHATDSSNAVVTDTIWIIVKGHAILSVSSPSDQTYLTIQNFNISWDVSGESTYTFQQTFSVSTNGTWTHTPNFGNWLDGDKITITDGLLPVGVYNYTMELRNSTHTVSDFVLITIINPILPTITIPADITVYSDQTFDLIWSVDTTLEGSYEILKNGSKYTEGNWSDGVIITITDGPLLTGYYNFTILITTSEGNSASFSVFVTVIDPALPPVFTPSQITSVSTTNTSSQITNSTVGDNTDEAFLSGFTFVLLSAPVMMTTIIIRRRSSN